VPNVGKAMNKLVMKRTSFKLLRFMQYTQLRKTTSCCVGYWRKCHVDV